MAKFRCLRCDRSFKMAAHLGRHRSTTHKRKSVIKPDSSYKCSLCGKGTRTHLGMEIHKTKMHKPTNTRVAFDATPELPAEIATDLVSVSAAKYVIDTLLDKRIVLTEQLKSIDSAVEAINLMIPAEGVKS